MRPPRGIVGMGDVIGTDGPGRTILAISVENGLIDKLAALRTALEAREPEPVLVPDDAAASSPAGHMQPAPILPHGRHCSRARLQRC